MRGPLHLPSRRSRMRHSLRAFLVLVTLCTLFLAACGGTSTASPPSKPSVTTLNVFAAASLTESFNEIGMKYERGHANIKITLNFHGTDVLVEQDGDGCPCGSFSSA